MSERRSRSLLKALSWRLTATTTTTVIAYFIIGKLDTALSIGSIELVAKMGLYYFHERAWVSIQYGKETPKKPDYHI